jgi:hypothetical protein
LVVRKLVRGITVVASSIHLGSGVAVVVFSEMLVAVVLQQYGEKQIADV